MMASSGRIAVEVASAQSAPSPTLPMPAPPFIDEALSYWVALSQLIDGVSVTVTGKAAGFLESPNTAVYTRYTLQGILIFCGIKQHRVHQTVDRMIAQMLSAAFAASQVTAASSSNSFQLLVDENTAAQGGPSQPASLSLLIKDRLLLSIAESSSQSNAVAAAQPQPGRQHRHLPRRYHLHVPAAAWERTIIKTLGNELRGQMICLRPLLRWNVACAKQGGQTPMVILIGGTSGSGKSTLARLVASQLGVENVLSTDTVRQVLRVRLAGRENDYPTLFLSTYEAYKAVGATSAEARSSDIVAAYESQCELILQVLDGILKRLLARRESVVIEGVHLLPKYLTTKRTELLVDHVICVPVIVRIPKADSHLERFCVRSRGMSLQSNKYIASFQAIRTIQSRLVSTVEASAMPVLVLTNTNVDKSFLVLHHAALEAMEHTALHGWPTDAAATVQVPLTTLAFAAAKRRLVAVVRQRRTRCGTTGASVEGEGGTKSARSRNSDKSVAAVRDGRGGTSAESLMETGERTPAPSDARASPPHSPALPCPCAAEISASAFVFPVEVNGAVTASSRARSAELFSTVQRRFLEQNLYYATRQNGATHLHADPLSFRPLLPNTRAKPANWIQALSTRTTDQQEPANTSVEDGRDSPFAATALRRSTSTSALLPSSFGAVHPSSRDGEEAFDELEVPSLIGS